MLHLFNKRNMEPSQTPYVSNNMDDKLPDKLPDKLSEKLSEKHYHLKREESITNFMKFSWSWTL